MCMECIEVIEKGLFCISHMNIKMVVNHITQVVKPIIKKKIIKESIIEPCSCIPYCFGHTGKIKLKIKGERKNG